MKHKMIDFTDITKEIPDGEIVKTFPGQLVLVTDKEHHETDLFKPVMKRPGHICIIKSRDGYLIFMAQMGKYFQTSLGTYKEDSGFYIFESSNEDYRWIFERNDEFAEEAQLARLDYLDFRNSIEEKMQYAEELLNYLNGGGGYEGK